MIRRTLYLSRSVSAITGNGAKARPSALSTRWSATYRAASRYFWKRAGDMLSDSAVLSNPSLFAGSTGNSRVGLMSTPVRSRMVLSYSALLSRLASTWPGSPACWLASRERISRSQRTTASRLSRVGCDFAFEGGMAPVSTCSSTRSQFSRSFATLATSL